jgi:hypothetical protein
LAKPSRAVVRDDNVLSVKDFSSTENDVTLPIRISSLFLIFLNFIVLPSSALSADAEKITVEQGQLVTIDVLDRSKARPGAALESAENANPAAGKVAITSNKRSVSYLASKDYVGSDLVTYKGKDLQANQDYNGQVEIAVVAPQRITTLNYTRVAGVLGIILVLAIVLEIGLATIFSWKYFQENYEGRGLRTPIAVFVSAFFVIFYKLDVVSDLLNSFTDNAESFAKTIPGYIITAFVVAGGSGTVNKLFAALGLRPPVGNSPASARLVIDFTRQNVPAAAPVSVSVDGVAVGKVATGNRFPETGQHPLPPGSHTIRLEAPDTTGVIKDAHQTVNLDAGAQLNVTMTL